MSSILNILHHSFVNDYLNGEDIKEFIIPIQLHDDGSFSTPFDCELEGKYYVLMYDRQIAATSVRCTIIKRFFLEEQYDDDGNITNQYLEDDEVNAEDIEDDNAIIEHFNTRHINEISFIPSGLSKKSLNYPIIDFDSFIVFQNDLISSNGINPAISLKINSDDTVVEYEFDYFSFYAPVQTPCKCIGEWLHQNILMRSGYDVRLRKAAIEILAGPRSSRMCKDIAKYLVQYLHIIECLFIVLSKMNHYDYINPKYCSIITKYIAETKWRDIHSRLINPKTGYFSADRSLTVLMSDDFATH